MKILVNIARIIVGILFIFSGLVKANDPLGLSYKMQEFFEVWGWDFFNHFTLAFSVIMIAFEIIAGVAVLLGWRMKLFSWLLLLLIIFFTFLTGYAVFSGKIRTCGCFGDCIPLTAPQSFTKDLVLTILIVFLFRYRSLIQPVFGPKLSAFLLLLTTAFCIISQAWVLKHLPVVDCLPYKTGKNILQQMNVPPGAIPDSTVITFVYNKQGKEVEFTSDKFPDDFDDSLYHFVKRYDKLVRKGNAEPAIKDFALKTASGNDTTQAIVSAPGYTVLVFVRDIEGHRSLRDDYRWLHDDFKKKNGALYIVTSQREEVLQKLENR
ncbi:MAG: DoxX family protein, partial [Bacteroidetes bacterium]|nr:DoxX family protein [Bacteroidota bacterium]